MITDLEKKFFDTFEIPEICQRGRETCEQYNRKCDNCPYFHYPQITDRRYLELIAYINKELITISKISGYDLEEVKRNILTTCIKYYQKYAITSNKTYNEEAKQFKQQIQALFKGGNNDNI